MARSPSGEARHGGGSVTSGTRGLTENVALSRAADGYADEYGGLTCKLHPSFKSFVYYGNFPERQSGPIAASYGLDAQGGKSGPPVTCLIALNPFNKFAISSVQETLAHEVFHCFQTQILGSWNKSQRSRVVRRGWLREGRNGQAVRCRPVLSAKVGMAAARRAT